MSKTRNEIIEDLYKTGKITFEEAMTLSQQPEKEAEPIKIGITTSKVPAFKTREEITKKLIDEALNGYFSEDDDEWVSGFDWDAIRNYLITKNWSALDLGQGETCAMKNIKDYPDLARHNAEYVAQEAIKDLYKDFDAGQSEDELESYCATGVFEATSWVEGGEVTLEVCFKPSVSISGVDAEEFKNAK